MGHSGSRIVWPRIITTNRESRLTIHDSRLSKPLLQSLQFRAPGTELLVRHRRQRRLHGVALVVKVPRLGREEEQSGDDLAFALALTDVGVGAVAIGGIVVLGDLPQPD